MALHKNDKLIEEICHHLIGPVISLLDLDIWLVVNTIEILVQTIQQERHQLL